jgi:hypothetical protein
MNRCTLGIIITILIVPLFAQESNPKLTLGGYLKYMQTTAFTDIREDWITDNLIHNRVDFAYYPKNYLSLNLSVRNRVFYGQQVQMLNLPNGENLYANMIDYNTGFFDLSWNYFENKAFFFNTSIDRAYVDLQFADLAITTGRQRINWGQTFVWNPNDLFNAYNYFDFDYEEKPGTDAIRVQYYLNYASRLELAAAVNTDTSVTAAVLYQFNKWQYDIQFISGLYKNDDVVVGTGWSGNLFKGAFRGELSYFHPLQKISDTLGIALVSLGYDYTVKNSLMLQFEYLFSSGVDSDNDFNMLDFYNQKLNAKNLGFFKHTIFGTLAYPINPLMSIAIAGMYSPTNNFTFIGPSFTVSLSNNFELNLNVQSFISDLPDNENGKGTYAFLRGRWSF